MGSTELREVLHTHNQVACLMLIVPIGDCFRNDQTGESLSTTTIWNHFQTILATKISLNLIWEFLCTISRKTNSASNFEVEWIPCELTYLRLFGYECDDLRGIVIFNKKVFFERPMLLITLGDDTHPKS